MNSGWTEYPLLELCEIHDTKRKPISSTEREKIKGSFPYYGASGIVDYINNYIFSYDTILISEDGENLNSRKTPIAFRATGKYWVNNHAHVLLPKCEHYFPIIINYLEAMDLNSYITGAVQPKLSQENLVKITIAMPASEEEQFAIARMLSSLDDKIDLLHRQNKTLEGMAEALWRKMFVVDAALDWEERSLLEIVDLVGGGTPKTEISEYWDGDMPWLSAKDITSNHKSFIVQTEKNITELGLKNSSTKILPQYSTIISARGTVGNYCILSKPMAFSQSNYGILPKIDGCFFFTYLLIVFIVDELKSAAYGSVFDTITTKTFSEQKITLPLEDRILSFEKVVKSYFEKIYNNTIQIRTLSHLRDTLLPKLMSGEVRVKM